MSINIDEVRSRLRQEKAELEQELARHGHKDFKTDDWQGSSENFGEKSADANEVADQIEELATNIPLVESLEDRYKNVLAALKKIEDGTYGTCEVGGEQIDPKRLEVNPAARTCVEHAETQ